MSTKSIGQELTVLPVAINNKGLPALDQGILSHIFSFLSHRDQAAVKTTCRAFQPKGLVALPADMLSRIFLFLAPRDRVAANASCKALFPIQAEDASLDFREEAIDVDTLLKTYATRPAKTISVQLSEETTDADLSRLVGLPIQELDLSPCLHLTDIGLAHISKLPLKMLNLPSFSGCGFTPVGLNSLAALKTTLKSLNLKLYPHVPDDGYAFLRELNLDQLVVHRYPTYGYTTNDFPFLEGLLIKDLTFDPEFEKPENFFWALPALNMSFLRSLTMLRSFELNYGCEFSLALLENSPLETLTLKGCTVISADHLAHFTQLQHLDISKAKVQLTTAIIESLIERPLRWVSLNGSDSPEVSLTSLSSLPLQALELRNFKHLTDESLKALSQMKTLSSLGLPGCTFLTDKGLTFFKDLPITSLDISDSFMGSAEGLKALKGWSHLSTLTLGKVNHQALYPPLKWKEFSTIKDKVEHLKDLSLHKLQLKDYVDLDDESLITLSKLPRLSSLKLPPIEPLTFPDLLKISGVGLKNLKHLSQLEGLSNIRNYILNNYPIGVPNGLDAPWILKHLNIGYIKVNYAGRDEVRVENGWHSYLMQKLDKRTWVKYVDVPNKRFQYAIKHHDVMEIESKRVIVPGKVDEITPVFPPTQFLVFCEVSEGHTLYLRPENRKVSWIYEKEKAVPLTQVSPGIWETSVNGPMADYCKFFLDNEKEETGRGHMIKFGMMNEVSPKFS